LEAHLIRRCAGDEFVTQGSLVFIGRVLVLSHDRQQSDSTHAAHKMHSYLIPSLCLIGVVTEPAHYCSEVRERDVYDSASGNEEGIYIRIKQSILAMSSYPNIR
jgi:hypothetical protein